MKMLKNKHSPTKKEASNFNKIYGSLHTQEVPKYLTNGIREWQIIAKFRCGGGEAANCYWRNQEEKRCQRCNGGEASLAHWLKDCHGTPQITEKNVWWLLDESGQGGQILSRIHNIQLRK